MKDDGRRFLGLNQPIVNSQFGYFNPTITTKDRVQSNLKHLLLTNKGERIMQPNFGCDIYRTLFENIDNIELPFETLKDRISDQIKLWMPYILLRYVGITVSDEDSNTVTVSVDYTWYGNTKDTLDIDIIIK